MPPWPACLAVLIVAAPAFAAEPACFPQADVISQLAETYGERPLFSGSKIGTNHVLIVFATPNGTSWTAMVQVGNQLCSQFAGDAWSLPNLAPGKDEPTALTPP